MQSNSKKAEMFTAIISTLVAVGVFGFTIALSNGWLPFSNKTFNRVHTKVIPMDEPVTVDSDVELTVKPIEVPEMVITVQTSKLVKVNPGAARRMPIKVVKETGPSEARELTELSSPTGIASKEALSYQPGFMRKVQGPKVEMQGHNKPRLGMFREHETMEFEEN